MLGMQPIGRRFYEGADVYQFFYSSGARCWCQLVRNRWYERLIVDEAARAVRELFSQRLIADGENLFMWWAVTEARRARNQQG
ncbi:hypothetical protein J3F84DRAFT_371582 [Trichoderma pleuroticola]